MIISFNAREKNQKGKEVIDWYERIDKSDRSRRIVDVLHAHILSNEHSINYPYDNRFFNARGGNTW